MNLKFCWIGIFGFISISNHCSSRITIWCSNEKTLYKKPKHCEYWNSTLRSFSIHTFQPTQLTSWNTETAAHFSFSNIWFSCANSMCKYFRISHSDFYSSIFDSSKSNKRGKNQWNGMSHANINWVIFIDKRVTAQIYEWFCLAAIWITITIQFVCEYFYAKRNLGKKWNKFRWYKRLSRIAYISNCHGSMNLLNYYNQIAFGW